MPPTIEELQDANRQARRDGLLAGATGGLAASIYGQRFLKMPPRTAWLGGLVAGALSGYFFSRAFLSTRLAKLHAESSRKAVVWRENTAEGAESDVKW